MVPRNGYDDVVTVGHGVARTAGRGDAVTAGRGGSNGGVRTDHQKGWRGAGPHRLPLPLRSSSRPLISVRMSLPPPSPPPPPVPWTRQGCSSGGRKPFRPDCVMARGECHKPGWQMDPR